MSRKNVSFGLLLVMLLQAGVLGGEYLTAAYPLWTGREIKLKTLPVDPRSLFRGNYARLSYGISSIPSSAYSESRLLRNGEIVFVRLKSNPEGLYDFAGISLSRPESGIFLRGRVTGRHYSAQSEIKIRYGIEAWFAPKEKALQMQRDLRSGGIAVVMVAKGGSAVLKGIAGAASAD